MEIKAYKSGDEVQILELFELVFKRPMSKEYWKWRFENNPNGKHLISLMWDKDTLAGHYAVSPVEMKIDGQVVQTALSMTTMTHPDYGRRGIFGTLANELYDRISKENNIQSVWGFPNNNSHYGFIKNLGWKNIGIAHEISLNVSLLKNVEVSSSITYNSEFNRDHAELLKLFNNSLVTVNKSTEYLNWRYKDNPTSDYTIIEYSNGDKLAGFIVVKKYRLNPTQYLINIVEIAIPESNIDILLNLLNGAVKHFGIDMDTTITLWLSLFDNRYMMFEKIGFTPSGKNTYLGYIPLGNDVDKMQYLNNWGYSFGDSDVY